MKYLVRLPSNGCCEFSHLREALCYIEAWGGVLYQEVDHSNLISNLSVQYYFTKSDDTDLVFVKNTERPEKTTGLLAFENVGPYLYELPHSFSIGQARALLNSLMMTEVVP